MSIVFSPSDGKPCGTPEIDLGDSEIETMYFSSFAEFEAWCKGGNWVAFSGKLMPGFEGWRLVRGDN